MGKNTLDKKNRNLVCYFPHLQTFHLTKDPIQIPNGISELYGYKSYIIANNKVNDDELEKYAPYVRLIILKKIFSESDMQPRINSYGQRIKQSFNRRFQPFNFVLFLILNLRKVNYLYLYNFGPNVNFDIAVFGIFYKILNPKGILHVRLEIGITDLSKSFPVLQNPNFKTYLLNSLYQNFIKKTSILGIIDDKNLSVSRSYPVFWLNAKNKLKQQLNGHKIIFNSRVLPYDEKNNYITIVGRLSSEEKGLKILLEALKNIDLKEWKVLLIGELDNNIKEYVDEFLEKNYSLKDKIVLIGNISDKDLYYSYLNKCKIFCTPFKYDGISLALVEAMAFGNVPVVTDFPGTRICTENGEYGFLFPPNDVNKLKMILQDLITNNEKLKSYSIGVKKFTEKNLKWDNIIKTLDLTSYIGF